MKIREAGWILAIDQASNAAGVSLWYNGELRATTVLRSKSASDVFSRRIQYQLEQLNDFLNEQLPPNVDVEKVLFEGVKSKLVLIVVGAFLCCHRIHAKMHDKASFVYSSSWKTWAKRHGATGPVSDIKGCKALAETGFDMDTHHIRSDDTADSILIYLAWRDRPNL